MPKKALLSLTLVVLVASVLAYRLGPTAVVLAKTHVLSEQASEPASLPTAPSNWSLTGESSSKLAASITQPAVAGAQHVITCIAFSIGNLSTGTLAATATLRNGPSGTGTPLWQYNVVLLKDTSVEQSVCGLNIVGSVDTDMTFETNVHSPTVGSFVNMVGYDAQ